MVQVTPSSQPWVLFSIYACTNRVIRHSLWYNSPSLLLLIISHGWPGETLMISLFVLKILEGLPLVFLVWLSSDPVWINCHLLDLGYEGPRFTWSNKRYSSDFVHEWLNWVVCNHQQRILMRKLLSFTWLGFVPITPHFFLILNPNHLFRLFVLFISNLFSYLILVYLASLEKLGTLLMLPFSLSFTLSSLLLRIGMLGSLVTFKKKKRSAYWKGFLEFKKRLSSIPHPQFSS